RMRSRSSSFDWVTYNDSQVLDSHVFSGANLLAAGDTEYQLDLSAVDDGIGNTTVTATLYTGGNELASLESTHATVNGAGWVGMFAGQHNGSNSSFRRV